MSRVDINKRLLFLERRRGNAGLRRGLSEEGANWIKRYILGVDIKDAPCHDHTPELEKLAQRMRAHILGIHRPDGHPLHRGRS